MERLDELYTHRQKELTTFLGVLVDKGVTTDQLRKHLKELTANKPSLTRRIPEKVWVGLELECLSTGVTLRVGLTDSCDEHPNSPELWHWIAETETEEGTQGLGQTVPTQWVADTLAKLIQQEDSFTNGLLSF